jgi:hypothetical protein
MIYNLIQRNRIFISIFILLLIAQFTYTFFRFPKGIENVGKINNVLKKEGNVGIIMSEGGAAPFIFEIAKNSKFNRQVFRPCLFLEINETLDSILQKFSIRYIIVWKTLEVKQLNKIAEIIKQFFPKVGELNNYVIYENNQDQRESRKILCNYVCSTREIICSRFKDPSNAFK